MKKVLDSGGFGITHLATVTSLGRKVVIKEDLPVRFNLRPPEAEPGVWTTMKSGFLD